MSDLGRADAMNLMPECRCRIIDLGTDIWWPGDGSDARTTKLDTHDCPIHGKEKDHDRD